MWLVAPVRGRWILDSGSLFLWGDRHGSKVYSSFPPSFVCCLLILRYSYFRFMVEQVQLPPNISNDLGSSGLLSQFCVCQVWWAAQGHLLWIVGQKCCFSQEKRVRGGQLGSSFLPSDVFHSVSLALRGEEGLVSPWQWRLSVKANSGVWDEVFSLWFYRRS